MKEKKKSVFSKLGPYMGKKKAYLAIALIFSALAAIINMFPFYYIWRITEEIFSKNNEISVEAVKLYAGYVLLFSVLGLLVYFLALMISHLAAFEVETGMKKVGFQRVMEMPLGFFNEHSSGKMRKVINDGAAATHGFLAHQLPDLAGTVVTPILLLIILAVFDWRLGIACLIPILLSFVTLSGMMSKEGKAFQQGYFDALEEMGEEAVEYVRAIPVVKTFGQSVHSFTKFYNSIENYRKLVITYTKLWVNPYSIYNVLVEATGFFLVPAAVLLIGRGDDVGGVISDFILYMLIAPGFGVVIMRSAYFQQQMAISNQSIDRFNQLFDYQEIEYPEKGCAFQNQSIEFKDVTFSYDGEKNAVDGVSFILKKGESLALVGPSGGGKTTIARLAARFWDANSGQVLIGGKDIKEYDKETLMDNISFVFQNNQLFKTSLLENITFGREDIPREEIESALVKSQSKEIIDGLENGLDTIIGKKGTYLSGGEQQRIALARAFLKDAPIVLLDEATAFADPENEHLIQKALLELSRGKTTIMIAHRMTTVQRADRIAVIDQGKIVEFGNHKELMEKEGLYKKMWDEYQEAVSWNIKGGK